MVIELNTDTGYLKAWFVVEQNDAHPEREVIRRNALGEREWYEAVGRFRFVPADPKPVPTVVMGAPQCGKCRSPLTLPGDELCPRCRAAERLQRNRFLVERITTPFLDQKCAKCTRTATWSVADEVVVTPEQTGKTLWERGMTVGRRYYCDLHYRPARMLDSKGEVVEDCRYAGPDVVKIGVVQ